MSGESGTLFLGGELDVDSGERTGASVHYKREHLTTHGVIVGMTGSGKTGLGVVLLEEVLRQGLPALILDPKGDMGNLLLSFPELAPADFKPWVDPGAAARKGLSVDQLAEDTAQTWTEGLAGWGLNGDALEDINAKAELCMWTPGSTAGTPMNVVGSLAAPELDFDSDAETLRSEIEAFVSSLLLLADVDADPISSPAHILLCHLIEKSWRAGKDLDLGRLIAQVANPPIRRLGVFDLDEFYPAKQRQKLAMRLNGLVASPSFATWMEGPPLDVQSLFYAPDGRPRGSVVYLPHLDEEQRQFVVTLILSKVVTWMRRQPGTSDLRALVYMDEVYGFAPPTKNPPSKKPILTLLKQARAHGLGLVLSTQNPVDLDYKAMSNAGTWMIGRLSTERDKARIVEALKSAAGDGDVDSLDTLIGGLGKRQFVLHGARRPAPTLFTTRWALSYLRGPLTRDEVTRLTAGRDAELATQDDSPAPERPAARIREPSGATVDARPAVRAAVSANGGAARVSRISPSERSDAAIDMVTHSAGDGTLQATVLPVARRRKPVAFPRVADGVPVHHLNPSAPWAPLLGVDPESERWEAAVIARVRLRFPDGPGGPGPVEEWEAVYSNLREDFVPGAGIEVDWDPRDLEGDPPAQAVVRRPAAPVEDPAWWDTVRERLQRWLDTRRTVDVLRNDTLGLVGRIGEDRGAFDARCRKLADERADAAAAERSQHYMSKIQTWRTQLEATTYKIDQAEAEAAAAAAQAAELADKAALLAGVLKGQLRTSEAAAAARKRQAAEARRDQAVAARGRVAKAWQDLAALERQLGDELSEIHTSWLAKAGEVRTERVERVASVELAHVGLVWMPVAQEAGS